MDLDAARRLLKNLTADEATCDRDPAGQPGARSAVHDIPGYRCELFLGEGAGGEVWLARWSRSDRPVALKLLRRPVADRSGDASGRRPGGSGRAWRELDMLSRLRLPCVPKLLDWGTHEGRLYFATEFVDGEQVDLACRTRDLSRRARVELLANIAAAAAKLHERGVIHRDLKPSNVLVTPAGDAIIIDLGIAAMTGSETWETLTAVGSPVGTPAFMAPEQARGDRDAIGTRSDVFAIGAIGYQMLTGRPPRDLSDATMYEAIRRAGHDEPVAATNPKDPIDQRLAAVLRRACAFAPDDRYASAAEFEADLRRWLRGEPVEAGHRSRWRAAVRWASAHPVLTTAMLCAAMVLATAASTIATLHWLARQPFSLQIAEDESSVWIESRGGFRLHTWTSHDPGKRFGAHRAETPDGWRAVVHAYERQTNQPRVAVYDPDDPARPILLLAADRPVPPPDYPDCRGDPYEPTPLIPVRRSVAVGDIFVELPGDELLVAERHASLHPTRLSVYQLNGQRLASVWVPGHINSSLILDQNGFVAVTGVNNFLTRHRAGGCEHAASYEHPAFMFTYRFRPHQLDDKWITHGTPGSSTGVVWCRMLDELATRRDRHDLNVPVFAILALSLERRGDSNSIVVRTPLRSDANARTPRVIFRLDAATGDAIGKPILEDSASAVPRLMPALGALRLVEAPAFDPNISP